MHKSVPHQELGTMLFLPASGVCLLSGLAGASVPLSSLVLLAVGDLLVLAEAFCASAIEPLASFSGFLPDTASPAQNFLKMLTSCSSSASCNLQAEHCA